ncbi:unnamed protein product [Lasius platythorax]|uniref:Uncharacterized protein n=1 Tax=Lasius platythorax TaxID=488582 RepID=A0AAV2N8E5_9HYME
MSDRRIAASPREGFIAVISDATRAILFSYPGMASSPEIYEASQRRGRIGFSRAMKKGKRPFGLSDKAEYSGARDRRGADQHCVHYDSAAGHHTDFARKVKTRKQEASIHSSLMQKILKEDTSQEEGSRRV